LFLSATMQRIFGLQRLASFALHKSVDLHLHIARGSVVDFSCRQHGAIVNAANEVCLGGGGVDGAITSAGGKTLAVDRQNLPVLSGGIRCPTGSAVLTGPGQYGSLHVPYVIHAVGPNYNQYDDFEKPDELLRSAYQTSLDLCRDSEDIEEVAFALLSAGIFRGKREKNDVLKIGIGGIRDWVSGAVVDDNANVGLLKGVTMYGFSDQETDLLLDICKGELEAK